MIFRFHVATKDQRSCLPELITTVINSFQTYLVTLHPIIVNCCRFISQLSQLQLVKMLTLIKDNLNGLSLDESLAKSKKLDTIDPNEDLNKVGVTPMIGCQLSRAIVRMYLCAFEYEVTKTKII